MTQDMVYGLLKDFRCLRVAHIHALMEAAGCPEEKVSRALGRLCAKGRARIWEGYAFLPLEKPDPDRIEAFDALIDLTGGRADNITAGSAPIHLLFTVRGDTRVKLFALAVVPYGRERHISSMLQKERSKDLIFVMKRHARPDKLIPIKNSYIALRTDTQKGGQGQYRYFSVEEVMPQDRLITANIFCEEDFYGAEKSR